MSKQDDRFSNINYDNHDYRGADYSGAPRRQAAAAPAAPQQDPASRPPRRKHRRLKRAARRGIALVVALAVMLGLAWVITQLIERGHRDDVVDPNQPAQMGEGTVAADDPPLVPNTLEPGDPLPELPAVDNTSWNFVGPVEQEGEPMSVITPDSRMIALPENGRVDMQFFDTAVFVGDSLTQGLEIYKQGIPNAKYCAYKGASPRSIYSGEAVTRTDGTSEVPLDALESYQPDNVYILMGTNAMVAMADEDLLAYYGGMIDAMKERLHPEVSFYIQSITPVLQGVDGRFDAARIAGLNNALAQMAFEKGCYFVDLHEALAGEDGWLRSDYGAKDGYHLQPIGYAAWVEYLVTHTAYNRRHSHLYLEGSHYYAQTAPAA